MVSATDFHDEFVIALWELSHAEDVAKRTGKNEYRIATLNQAVGNGALLT